MRELIGQQIVSNEFEGPGCTLTFIVAVLLCFTLVSACLAFVNLQAAACMRSETKATPFGAAGYKLARE